MNPFDSITAPRKMDLLVCFCDIDSFLSIARGRPDTLELFELLDGFAREIQAAVHPTPGRIIKFIGDSALIAFPEESADEGMRVLLELKPRLESYLADHRAKAKVLFQVHFGEVAIGPFGGDRALDILGDSVNVAARLGRGEHRGSFVVSPQAFRKLRPATRKAFHKHTPPIVYVAES